MNLMKYRFDLDKNIDNFARENFEEIYGKDNEEEINYMFFDRDTAQT